MPHPTVPCTNCNHTGTVPHQKRTLDTNDQGAAIIDPSDHQTVELCPTCGGSGMMKAPPPSASG